MDMDIDLEKEKKQVDMSQIATTITSNTRQLTQSVVNTTIIPPSQLNEPIRCVQHENELTAKLYPMKDVDSLGKLEQLSVQMETEQKLHMAEFQDDLKKFIMDLRSQFNLYDIQVHKNTIVTILPVDVIKEKYSWLMKLTIDFENQQVVSNYLLCRENNKPLLVNDLHLRLLVCRNFSRYNSQIRFGCWSIHPLTGEITIKMVSYCDQVLFTKMLKQDNLGFTQQFTLYLRTAIHQARLQIFQLTPRILFMINEEDNDVFKEPDVELVKKIRQVHDDCKKKYEKCIQQIRRSYINYSMNSNDKEDRDYFRVPKQNISNGLKTQIYSRLRIVKMEKNENQFHGGGFAAIYRAKITYQVPEEDQPINASLNSSPQQFQRQLAVKQEKTDQADMNRIEHEKKILALIQDKENPYVAKFYYSLDVVDGDDLSKYLFMEYYPNKSLDNFKNAFKNTMSLNTKIYMLLQVAQGLKFLKENQIVHLDLKPANILIQKNYIAKITDFGESYNSRVCDEKFRPGRTYPFVAPEVTQSSVNAARQSEKYTDKADIFSFGHLISEIIYDDYPVCYKKGNQQSLATKYSSGKYQQKLFFDSVKGNGPIQLSDIIFQIIASCIEEKELRPYIEYLVIILRDCLNYIERLY